MKVRDVNLSLNSHAFSSLSCVILSRVLFIDYKVNLVNDGPVTMQLESPQSSK